MSLFGLKKSHYTQNPFKNAVGTPPPAILTEKYASTFCEFYFWFGSNPKKYLSLCIVLFFLHLGTHPSNTGEELVYYNLYHEEA